MSLTKRDERALKGAHSDTSDTEGSSQDPGAETMDDPNAARAAGDVVATLCRMSLVRHETLSINGAYVRNPPAIETST